MVYTLAVLIIGGLVCAALRVLSVGTRHGWIARVVGLLAVAAALATSLVLEGFSGGPSRPVIGAEVVGWLGADIYLADPLSTGVGAWALAIGFLSLLTIGRGASQQDLPIKMAMGVGLIAVLYGLAFTVDLRAFAAQVLVLVLLIWAVSTGTQSEWQVRQRVSLVGGALLLLAAVLLAGRTTGGEYNLGALSLSALTLWPLVMIVGWALLWLGLSPFTGWSALSGGNTTLVHGLALGVPPILLVVRLQGLVTEGALTGSTPGEWAAAMSAFTVLGCITTIVGGAGVFLWAGTQRWRAALTAQWMGTIAWALGLDSPAGRWAALALLAAYGVGGLALEIASHVPGETRPSPYAWVTRTVAGMCIAGAPLTASFVGLWLLSVGLLEARVPALAIALVGAVVMGACGTALHLAQPTAPKGDLPTDKSAASTANRRYRFALDLIGWALVGIMVAGGVLPRLWLPYLEAVAGVAGRGQSLDLPWMGIARDVVMLPLIILGAGAVVLALAGWLIRAASSPQMEEAGALLPTALERLQRRPSARLKGGANTEWEDAAPAEALRPAPPAFVWWLSLAWLERGIYDAGALLARLGAAVGRLTERLEGRYFLPLIVLLALLAMLAVTR